MRRYYALFRHAAAVSTHADIQKHMREFSTHRLSAHNKGASHRADYTVRKQNIAIPACAELNYPVAYNAPQFYKSLLARRLQGHAGRDLFNHRVFAQNTASHHSRH